MISLSSLPSTSPDLFGRQRELAALDAAWDNPRTNIVTLHEGDIRKRDLVPRLTADAKHGEHARRIMEAYERWFEGKPEQEILRLMGLLDRPADPGPLRILRQPPRARSHPNSALQRSAPGDPRRAAAATPGV